jgi:2-amino-4-hydroxy-6-hydroxymethyldihydropteridine diphosphokinase
MIFVGLGANMPSRAGEPTATLHAALAKFSEHGITVVRVSPFYRSAPVPISDQPWFVNAVAEVKTALSPEVLMQTLLQVEKDFGRERSVKNAPRLLDLDLLDYAGQELRMADLELPHPRLHERAFVLYPLRDLAPEWKHPDGKKIAVLAGDLGPQKIEKI